MRFQNFHLYKTDFSSESLESLLSCSAQDTDSTEQNNLGSYIQKTAYALEGVSWSACNRPLSTYARNRLLYIQNFTYYEVRNYYTRRDNDKFYSFLLKYTYEGEGELVYEGKTYSLGPNQGFVIDCKKPHEYRALKSPWNHVEIHFSGAPANYIYEQFASGGIVRFEQPADFFHPELEKLLELHESILPYQELQISHQLEHLLLAILLHSDSYLRTVQKVPEDLRYLLTYIEHNFMQPLSLDFMAEFSNISKYHLCRLFQKHLGFSPNEYLIQLRLENAKKLLLNTSLPANKIASMVGIADENYFYRLFKNRVGISVREFRKGCML